MREFQEAIAVFDLDRTITRFGTFSPFLAFSCMTKPWRFLYSVPILFWMFQYKMGWMSRERLKERMLFVVAGRKREALKRCSKNFATFLIKHCLHPGAIECIQKHAEAGHLMVLATASMDFYAEEIGRQLGFDTVVATPSTWTGDDRLSEKLGGKNCYGEAKMKYIKERVVELDGKLAGFERHAYTDHHSDLPLLEWASKPHVVNPKKKLKDISEARGYPVLIWNQVN